MAIDTFRFTGRWKSGDGSIVGAVGRILLTFTWNQLVLVTEWMRRLGRDRRRQRILGRLWFCFCDYVGGRAAVWGE